MLRLAWGMTRLTTDWEAAMSKTIRVTDRSDRDHTVTGVAQYDYDGAILKLLDEGGKCRAIFYNPIGAATVGEGEDALHKLSEGATVAELYDRLPDAPRVEDVERFTVNDVEPESSPVLLGELDDYHLFREDGVAAGVGVVSSPAQVALTLVFDGEAMAVLVDKENAAQVARVLRRAVSELERLADGD